MAEHHTTTPLRTATYTKVKDLVPGADGYCLVVRVISVDAPQEYKLRNGSVKWLAEVVVGDDTGAIILSARDEQIDIAKKGRNLVIRNAEVAVFRGFMRLRVTKWGKVALHPDGIASTPKAPRRVAASNNVSLVEYELVAREDDET
ncbi:hypothetical protein ACHHYP_08081 [Achlya hypogyna]|uniref:Single-stranded DNA binding protein Ssb-like OB fold domain-containing protein n=1 Tax=Achlya hypogyna TaxID=1202772 RepID=A0A1V9YQ26_ACHHY|nr:hypothetical protein ACHHYP_08081 [Achlya hypogyna]